MKLTEFVNFLNKIDNTTKRLEITTYISDLIRGLKEDEIENAVNLSLGVLKAPFKNPKFNIAEEMMIKIITRSLEITDKQKVKDLYDKSGDMGETYLQLCNERNLETYYSHKEINEIHEELRLITELQGNGSQELKITKISNLLKTLHPKEARYIIRIILGQIRLGFSELTIIAGLAEFLGDKKYAKRIEEKYTLYPDIGKISYLIKSKGLKGLEKLEIEIGVPILVQRCQRVATTDEAIEKMGTVWAEYKFDGTRVQLHLDRHKVVDNKNSTQTNLFNFDQEQIYVKTFTRNLEETTQQFPDIIEAAHKQLEAESIILDGEAIGFDKDTGEFLPFQETIQRKRKHKVSDSADTIPLKYFVFDILYLNGKSLLDNTLTERRLLLENVVLKGEVIAISSYFESATPEELEGVFDSAKKKSLEGLVIKKPNALYQAGARSYNWVKLKIAQEKILEDTIDGVVLGYYFGRGARAEFGIGGFLVGIKDEKSDTYKSITKVGTGLKEEDFIHLKQLCDKNRVSTQPQNVEVGKNLVPDIWTSPKIVVEIGGDEITKSPSHSAGYAVRFPRLLKFREDKSSRDVTTLQEIIDLHKLQKRAYYSEKSDKN